MAFKLDRLQDRVAIVDKDGNATPAFQLLIQNAFRSIENEFGAIEAAAAAQVAADAANAAAAAAQAAADNADLAASNAQGAADTAAADASLANSGASGLTMTATDAGANATITVSAHSRVYGDGTSVALAGGNVTGLAYSTIYYVYYNDPSRAGGSVTYLASTNANDAIQTAGVHSLGVVQTPAALGVPIDGNYNLPPGVEPWF